MTISPDKEKALETAMTQVERQFGKGSIMKLGSRPVVDVPVISTSSLALDKALGIGGLPRGRVIEIYGPEASGKTTLALHAVAEAQKKDGIAAFIDAEHALDTAYAKKLGVNCDDLLVAQPDTGEQALEICDMLVRSGALDVLVVDLQDVGARCYTYVSTLGEAMEACAEAGKPLVVLDPHAGQRGTEEPDEGQRVTLVDRPVDGRRMGTELDELRRASADADAWLITHPWPSNHASWTFPSGVNRKSI